ncbi:glyoxalase/bleomycin resistance/dioxygenase family protein [Chromobacterium sp. ATCC 53434]|uniref:VOC family protein n=1 Tax=Chromobacterium sp. (strain ATCC 53434 / SC 14030) TaxID=2059672 RepID=UPI000C7609B0|nr:VOC family protein [Chromobacterium sp. ATCC 53434]AUH50710.1 glyoxalase/bleomycin resistance/dioxygenase family protein [Chromobacterium sp. ATCC 53434]
MTPDIHRIDHIHVYARDRAAAETWYRRVLGLSRVPELEVWSPGRGPLTVANAAGTLKLALFERADVVPGAVIALGVDADGFLQWRAHLRQELGELPEVVDHDLSWSMYFVDPDGNGYEITSYDYAALAKRLSGETSRA